MRRECAREGGHKVMLGLVIWVWMCNEVLTDIKRVKEGWFNKLLLPTCVTLFHRRYEEQQREAFSQLQKRAHRDRALLFT